jgi:hypothetical protein
MVQLPKAINLMQLLIETDPELLFPVPPVPALLLSFFLSPFTSSRVLRT